MTNGENMKNLIISRSQVCKRRLASGSKRCPLGYLCDAEGISIKENDYPYFELCEKFNSQVIHSIWNTNDNAQLTEEAKENRLVALFKQLGYNLTFIK